MSELHLPDHVVVVGAGIIGLTVAWELARTGHDVFVVDRDRPGYGATRTAGGMLGLTAEAEFGESDLLELEKKSLSIFADFVDALRDDSDIDPHYRTTPTLVVARDRDDTEALERIFDYQRRHGLEPRWLDADQVRRDVPHLRRVHRAVACGSDHVVDTDRLTDALVGACRCRGVRFAFDASVQSVITKGGRARGIYLDDGRKFFAPRTVVCAGAWSRTIAAIPEFDRSVLRPVRGQTVVVDTPREFDLDRVVRSPDVYVVPRAEGRVVIGSTMEEKGFQSEVTAGAVRTLLEEAWHILPAIDECPVAALSCGFRPVSLDARPLIGPSELPGLYLATGHGRHGILLAPVTGRIMARYMDHTAHARRVYRAFDPRRFNP